jgi:hypothetical protein
MSAQVIDWKKHNMIADVGRLHCQLFRAIDTQMTLARRCKTSLEMFSSEACALRKDFSEQEIFPVRVIQSEEYSPRSGCRDPCHQRPVVQIKASRWPSTI